MKGNINELHEKIARLYWLLNWRHVQDHARRGPLADRTRGQGRVLAILKMQPEITAKELSFLLDIRQQSLNELLNKLEKTGYIVREPSQADKRVMMIKLTEKGMNEEQEEIDLADIFDNLAEEEREMLAGYLDRLIEALEAQKEDDDDQAFEWIDASRRRMGEEQFERFMSMRRGGNPYRRGFDPDERRGGRGNAHDQEHYAHNTEGHHKGHDDPPHSGRWGRERFDEEWERHHHHDRFDSDHSRHEWNGECPYCGGRGQRPPHPSDHPADEQDDTE